MVIRSCLRPRNSENHVCGARADFDGFHVYKEPETYIYNIYILSKMLRILIKLNKAEYGIKWKYQRASIPMRAKGFENLFSKHHFQMNV